MPSLVSLPRRLKNWNTGITSERPTPAPNPVAWLRCSGVAPASSARVRASPAPDAPARPVAAIRPAAPNGPATAKGITDPPASPNLRGIVSSYPGWATNGLRAAVATSPIKSRVDFSAPSGNTADAPIAADSRVLTTPAGIPLRNSLV